MESQDVRRPKRRLTRGTSAGATHSSSPSDLSEDASIYNAARASSGEENNGNPDPGRETLDSRTAGNMAMFLSRESENPRPYPTMECDPELQGDQQTKQSWWQLFFSSDNHRASTTESDQGEGFKSSLLGAAVLGQRRPLKAASLNDAESNPRAPKWPDNVSSPASPGLPAYPPPARAPTPPGLPSFGTPQAMAYSTIDGQAHPQDPNAPRRAADGSRTSLSHSFRRFIGRSPAGHGQSLPQRQPRNTVRADDGTIIQGRFPHRHSGHGTSVGRRLDDHPFHRCALPVAQCHDAEGPDRVSTGTDGCRDETQAQRLHGERGRSYSHSKLRYGTVWPSHTEENLVARPRTQSPTSQRSLGRLLHSPRTAGADQPSFHPTSGVSSYHSSVSQARATNNGPATQTPGAANPNPIPTALQPASAPITITATRTRSDSPSNEHRGVWSTCLRTLNNYICCCCRTADPDSMASSSNDTYATARSQVSQDSAEEGNGQAGPRNETCVQKIGRWCVSAWMSFRAYAEARVAVIEGMV